MKEFTIRGEEAYLKGKGFEQEVAEIYRMLGFDVEAGINIEGIQFDLKIQKEEAGFFNKAFVECKDTRITAKERDQILAQRLKLTRTHPGTGHFVISTRGFAEQTKTALVNEGIQCLVYKELLSRLFPLDKYVRNLVSSIEEWINDKDNWNGEDRFIRPDILTDITREKVKAITYFTEWLWDEKLNHLTILGDLGTGKSTLATFLSYTLGRAFLKNPLKHPAPVLIPLKDVRKAVDLPSIVIHHFSQFGIPDVNYSRFDHLVKKGKIILFFDAFDEMAEKIEWETTRENFRELKKIVGDNAKVILTCRTHFFVNREEQATILGTGSPTLSEIETDLYRDITSLPEYRLVYLEEFTDDQVMEYLNKTRGKTAKADLDKIKSIYNLEDLAHRPLLLDMIVKSLPRLEKGQQISASQLYKVYTGIWLDREQEKHPHLIPDIAECMMRLLSWFMWDKDESNTNWVNSLVMHKSNRLFSGSDDHTIREWDTEKGECVRILKGYTSYVRSLVILRDNKTLYSGSDDNTVIAWDIATGKRKATFVQMEGGMWLCYLPDGRFTGNPKAVQYLAYMDTETREVYPAEELVERFYKPEEVMNVLRGVK